MSSEPLPTPALDPKVLMLARVCGRTLLLAFLVVILASVLPIELRSVAWGTQLTSRIVDAASFPLLGVALLRLATLLQEEPNPRNSKGEYEQSVLRKEAKALAKQKDVVLLLCRSSMVVLALVAVWQIPLLIGGISVLDQQNQARSGQLNQRISQGELTIRQAPAAAIQREWQRLSAAGAPGISSDIRDPEKQRELLLKQLERQQQQLGRTLGNQDGQGRLVLLRNSLRVLALCGIYIAAFQGISSGLRKFSSGFLPRKLLRKKNPS